MVGVEMGDHDVADIVGTEAQPFDLRHRGFVAA